MLVLVMLVIGTLTYLVRDINRTNVQLSRDAVTRKALAQAKEALIARAAIDDNNPGSLPCPDRDNDGVADTTFGSACTTAGAYNTNLLVGRLPWKTLDLPDLRDGDGERLWYALSLRFTDRLDSRPLNSDTPGQLTLLGASPAEAVNAVVAIIFSPGSALAGQLRDGVNINNVSSYLEGENNYAADAARSDAVWTSPAGSNNAIFESRAADATFNDTALALRHEDLFPIVENLVARRIQREIGPMLEAYRKVWGAYPYAAKFDGRQSTATPAPPAPVGEPGRLQGLLPIGLTGFGWSGGAGGACHDTSAPLPTGATSLTSSRKPSGECELVVTTNAGVTEIVVPLLTTPNATLGFAGSYDTATKLVSLFDAATLTSAPAGASIVDATASFVPATDAGRIDYKISIPATSITLTIKAPNVLDTTTLGLAWYFANDWHRLTYYRISSGFAPGKASCAPGPDPCLSVTIPNRAPDAQARAVLVLAGRSLDSTQSTTRAGAPPGSPDYTYLAGYFERDNNELASAPNTAEAFAGLQRAPGFNDKIIYVDPLDDATSKAKIFLAPDSQHVVGP